MDKRIGAQLYTVTKFLQTVEDFDESLRKVKEMGYETIQISGSPLKAEEMKPIVDKYGLKVVVTHRDYEEFVENPQEIIEYNRILGCDICGMSMMPKANRETSETLTEFIQNLDKAAKTICDAGLQFGYHNHAFEFAKIGGKSMMARILEETDPNCMKFIIDTYWLQFAGLNPAKFIHEQSDRVVAFHLKDLQVDKFNKVVMAEIGEGNMDWDDILAACEESKAKWALVEQDVCQRDPFESLKMSRDYLTAKGYK